MERSPTHEHSRVPIATALFAAYQAQDAGAASALLADDFDFVSPQDAHLDKQTWLDVCFPTADHFATFQLLELIDGDPVFVRYEYTLADGKRYRNVEAITVRDGQVHATEVYFGGEL